MSWLEGVTEVKLNDAFVLKVRPVGGMFCIIIGDVQAHKDVSFRYVDGDGMFTPPVEEVFEGEKADG